MAGNVCEEAHCIAMNAKTRNQNAGSSKTHRASLRKNAFFYEEL